jgi:hypothetical protein
MTCKEPVNEVEGVKKEMEALGRRSQRVESA